MKKAQSNLIAGLDIGSNKVRMSVGQATLDTANYLDLQILGAVEYESDGVYKGKINSIEDLVSSISGCLEQTERMVGMPIDSVWVAVAGIKMMIQDSKGIIAVSKSNNEINDDDVSRALEASRSLATPLNYEILHVLSKKYTVDNQFNIKDPVGMTGMRLEVDSNVILESSSYIKNLTKAVYRTGLEIDDLILSILASAESVLTKKQKELGTVVIDLGASTTGLAVYEEGELLHATILPIGSENITNDLAIGLRNSVEIAEEVKKQFGDCRTNVVSRTDTVDLIEVGAETSEKVKQRYINEIIQARVEEILEKVNEELKVVQRSGLLPAGSVFCGEGSKLPGLVEISKKVLCLPASLGYPLNINSISDKAIDPGFSTVIGLVKWGGLMESQEVGKGINIFKGIGKAIGQVKKWGKILIP